MPGPQHGLTYEGKASQHRGRWPSARQQHTGVFLLNITQHQSRREKKREINNGCISSKERPLISTYPVVVQPRQVPSNTAQHQPSHRPHTPPQPRLYFQRRCSLHFTAQDEDSVGRQTGQQGQTSYLAIQTTESKEQARHNLTHREVVAMMM